MRGFSDPHSDKEDHFDFTLLPDAAVMIDRSTDMDREPFYDDPKDKSRRPHREDGRARLRKDVHIRHNQVSYLLGDQQTPTLQWISRDGTSSPPKAGTTFPAPSLTPAPVKDKNEQQFRDRGIKAANELNQILQKKETDVALAEYMQSVQKAAEREVASSKERVIGQDTIVRWMHAMRCYSPSMTSASSSANSAHRRRRRCAATTC